MVENGELRCPNCNAEVDMMMRDGEIRRFRCDECGWNFTLTLTGLKSRDSREVDSLGTPKGFRGLPCWTGYPRLSAGSGKVFDHGVESRSASVRMFKAAFTSLS